MLGFGSGAVADVCHPRVIQGGRVGAHVCFRIQGRMPVQGVQSVFMQHTHSGNRFATGYDSTGLHLTWLLNGIGSHVVLRDTLVFKGGTALKKCYFGRYRFSEDLDFTALQAAPQGEGLAEAIDQACHDTAAQIRTYAPIDLHWERYTEREPHPQGQEAFTIRAQFPWQRAPLTKVMIEVSRAEVMLFPHPERSIIQDYHSDLNGQIQVYSLSEVVLEKLRAILQHTRKLHERDWSRSRARDYYDLWHILCQPEEEFQLANVAPLLKKKCVGKGVGFSIVSDFFDPIMIANVRKTWSQWLGPLVHGPPSVDRVLDDLQPVIADLLIR